MSYPQTLIPKRRVRGPMDELLPDGSTVLEALQRLQRPSMAPVLAEQSPVMPDVPTRMIVPPIGNEPSTRPRLVNSLPITGAPDVRGMSPEIINSALKRISPGTLETDTQPTDSTLQLQRPIPLETINGLVPMGAMPESLGASRPRLVLPVNPLQRAAENYQASLSAPPDYGQDAQGNQRTQAKRGWAGRTLAALKTLGMDMLQGRGLIASAADATHAAINPDILAKRRLLGVQGENRQEYGNQIGIAGEQAKLGQIQANADYLRQRPDFEAVRLGQGQQRIDQTGQRMTQAQMNAERQALLAALKTRPTLDATRDTDLIAKLRKAGVDVDPANYKGGQPIFIEGVLSDPYTGNPILRDGKQIVDRTKVPVEYQGYTVTPGTAVSAIGADTRQQRGIAATDAREERSAARSDARQSASDDKALARQEEADRRGAIAQLNLARSKREQAARLRASGNEDAAQQLESDASDIESTAAINYPNVVDVQDSENTWGARRRTYKIKERTQSAPSRSMPKLNEQAIRDAAKARNLDPDEAVRRAKARGQL